MWGYKVYGKRTFPKMPDGIFNALVDVTPLYIGAGLRLFPFLPFHKTLCLLQSRFCCASTNPTLKESPKAPQELLIFR